MKNLKHEIITKWVETPEGELQFFVGSIKFGFIRKCEASGGPGEYIEAKVLEGQLNYYYNAVQRKLQKFTKEETDKLILEAKHWVHGQCDNFFERLYEGSTTNPLS